MTARVAYEMGAERVLEYGRRLGVYGDDTQAQLALALGAGETTLMRLTTAYGIFVNGGRRIRPILIDNIQDGAGQTLFDGDPGEADAREQVLDPITAFQIVYMTQGVVQRGTGSVINELGIPLGGKTGASNDNKDAWFIGYSANLVVGVWVGFDTPRNMGEGETGGRIAAPIFRDFMQAALNGTSPTAFEIPAGMRLVRIDANTGLPPTRETRETILEAFRPGTEPTTQSSSSPFN